MDTLTELKNKEFKQALDNLKDSSILEYSDISRDSTLLRFELTSEIAWKVLKIYLENQFRIQCSYPVQVYREALKAQILNADNAERALVMVNDRNRMVHDYNQAWAEELYKKILKDYIPLLDKIHKAVLR
ncbi:MAG: HI0074 family nucleotidyltransferase substrate-binding subunit [Patescibacteria group bacterium]